MFVAVRKREFYAVPLRVAVYTVTGNAGSILHYRKPLIDYFIKKRRLSHIVSADNSNNRHIP